MDPGIFVLAFATLASFACAIGFLVMALKRNGRISKWYDDTVLAGLFRRGASRVIGLKWNPDTPFPRFPLAFNGVLLALAATAWYLLLDRWPAISQELAHDKAFVRTGVQLLGNLQTMGFVIASMLAVWLQISPSVSRYVKYEAILALSMVWVFVSRFFLGCFGISTGPRPEEMLPLAVELLLFGPLLSFGLGRLNQTHRIVISRLWRWVNPLSIAAGGVLWLFSSLACYALPLILARYLMGEYLLRYPIVYLRSFGMRETPEVYGLIGSAALKAYGMPIAVFHENELPHTVQRHASPWGFTKPLVLPDTDWQDTVERLLVRASAVLIDATHMSKSLQWEIGRTLALSSPQRLLIAVHSAEHSWITLPDGGQLMTYELGDRAKQDRAAKLISRWCENAVLAGDSPLAPDQQPRVHAEILALAEKYSALKPADWLFVRPSTPLWRKLAAFIFIVLSLVNALKLWSLE